jgi:hypothetical protein
MNGMSEIQAAVTAEKPKPERHMMRALISAVVFGLLGAQLGKWLGHHGRHSERQLAKPIMKWGMAAFWAVLAAYSSFKADEHAAGETEEKRTPEDTQRIVAKSAPIAAQTETPAAHIDAGHAKLHGRMAESQLQRSA